MNILLITEYFPEKDNSDISGGVESRAYNIAKNLAKKHDITILTSWRKGLKRKEIFSGFKVLRVGPNHEYTNQAGFFSRINLASALVEEGIKQKNIDIIDSYNFTTYLPAYKIAKKLKKPVIATYHETWIGNWVKNKGIITGIPYELYERLLLFLNFDLYISVSNFTKDRLIKNRIKKEKIIVIPNGVDLKKLKRTDAKKEKQPTLCFIGRLVETKRVDILIRAIKQVKSTIPNIQCNIIGKGKELSKLKQLTSDLDLQENIHFLGFIEKNEDVMGILKSAHVFCHPSILEGFGIILLEAMALEVPYVCSDILPFREATQNGKGGFLFKSKDYKEMAEKIIVLLENKELYNEKREEEKQNIIQFDWELITNQIEKAYINLIE